MHHINDSTDLTVEQIYDLIDCAGDIAANPKKYANALAGKKLATLFFEPSTRTRLSFEAAMYELGGNVIGFSSAAASSTSKGESLGDTIRTVGCYADIIAMRHPMEGAAFVACMKSPVPIINAGDGGHCHPTQTLTDLLTIHKEKGRLDHLKIGICGDLKFGRTVHSLINAMSRYEGNEFVMISPEELSIPHYIQYEILEPRGSKWTEARNIEDVIGDLDILYMTRIQRERFNSEEEYNRLKDCFVLNADKMTAAKSDMIVMHPLPRVTEISTDVDGDPRACYFKQVLNGKHIRMALMLRLLQDAYDGDWVEKATADTVKNVLKCTNPRCISSTERELPHLFSLRNPEKKVYRCVYCENKIITDDLL